MPRRPLHPCRQQGCPALVEQRYCDRHRKEADAADRERRGSAASRGYDKDHRRRREAVLARDPACVSCLSKGEVTPSRVADHIIPLSEWPQERIEDAWDLENGAGLCIPCHNRKTMRERRERGKLGAALVRFHEGRHFLNPVSCGVGIGSDRNPNPHFAGSSRNSGDLGVRQSPFPDTSCIVGHRRSGYVGRRPILR